MNALTIMIFLSNNHKINKLLIALIWHKIKSSKQMLSLFNDY